MYAEGFSLVVRVKACTGSHNTRSYAREGIAVRRVARGYVTLRRRPMETVGIFATTEAARKWLELPENGSGA